MSDIYPLVIVKDRYNGTYSGGKWTAWNLGYVPSKVDADDIECADFFSKPNLIFGRGETPQEAIDDLNHMRYYGGHMTMERIKEVNISDDEEEKMKPTSVWKIENIDDIWTYQEGNMMSLALKNKDDLTKIILTGEAIKKHNDNFPVILKSDIEEYNKITKENEKKIHKLEEENEEHKAKNKDSGWKKDLEQEIKRLTDRLANADKENAMLEKELESIRGYLITETKRLRKKCDADNKLQEEPSTRADILDQAKKCVCGQREQDYGSPESNFQLIADLWNDYLGNNLSKEKRDFEKELGITHNHKESSVPWEISAMDVSMMMALLKIARIRNGGGSGDSFVDLAGYAACGGEIWEEKRKNKDQK